MMIGPVEEDADSVVQSPGPGVDREDTVLALADQPVSLVPVVLADRLERSTLGVCAGRVDAKAPSWLVKRVDGDAVLVLPVPITLALIPSL